MLPIEMEFLAKDRPLREDDIMAEWDTYYDKKHADPKVCTSQLLLCVYARVCVCVCVCVCVRACVTNQLMSFVLWLLSAGPHFRNACVAKKQCQRVQEGG